MIKTITATPSPLAAGPIASVIGGALGAIGGLFGKPERRQPAAEAKPAPAKRALLESDFVYHTPARDLAPVPERMLNLMIQLRGGKKEDLLTHFTEEEIDEHAPAVIREFNRRELAVV